MKKSKVYKKSTLNLLFKSAHPQALLIDYTRLS